MAKETRQARPPLPEIPDPVPAYLPPQPPRDELQMRRETQTELGRLQGQVSSLRVQAHDLQATVANLTLQRQGLDQEIAERRMVAQQEIASLTVAARGAQEQLIRATTQAQAMENMRFRDVGRVAALSAQVAQLTGQLQTQASSLMEEEAVRQALMAVRKELQSEQDALQAERAATAVVRAERTKLAGEIRVAREGTARQSQTLKEREQDLISGTLVLEERERVCGARLLTLEAEEHRLTVVQHALEEQETAHHERGRSLRETERAQAKIRQQLDDKAGQVQEAMGQAQDMLAQARTMQEVARFQDEAVARRQSEIEALSATHRAAQEALDQRKADLDTQQAMLQRVSVEITHARGRLMQEAKRLQVDPGTLGVSKLPAGKG